MKKTDNNGILFLFRGCTKGLKRYFLSWLRFVLLRQHSFQFSSPRR